jgi:hypothetical protein
MRREKARGRRHPKPREEAPAAETSFSVSFILYLI